MQVKKQHLELERLYMEQQTGFKQEKEYVKAAYCHPAYITYMQSKSWKIQGWMKHKLESRLLGEISVTSDMQMTYNGSDKQIQEIISNRVTEEPWMDVRDIVH